MEKTENMLLRHQETIIPVKKLKAFFTYPFLLPGLNSLDEIKKVPASFQLRREEITPSAFYPQYLQPFVTFNSSMNIYEAKDYIKEDLQRKIREHLLGLKLDYDYEVSVEVRIFDTGLGSVIFCLEKEFEKPRDIARKDLMHLQFLPVGYPPLWPPKPSPLSKRFQEIEKEIEEIWSKRKDNKVFKSISEISKGLIIRDKVVPSDVAVKYPYGVLPYFILFLTLGDKDYQTILEEGHEKDMQKKELLLNTLLGTCANEIEDFMETIEPFKLIDKEKRPHNLFLTKFYFCNAWHSNALFILRELGKGTLEEFFEKNGISSTYWQDIKNDTGNISRVEHFFKDIVVLTFLQYFALSFGSEFIDASFREIKNTIKDMKEKESTEVLEDLSQMRIEAKVFLTKLLEDPIASSVCLGWAYPLFLRLEKIFRLEILENRFFQKFGTLDRAYDQVFDIIRLKQYKEITKGISK